MDKSLKKSLDNKNILFNKLSTKSENIMWSNFLCIFGNFLCISDVVFRWGRYVSIILILLFYHLVWVNGSDLWVAIKIWFYSAPYWVVHFKMHKFVEGVYCIIVEYCMYYEFENLIFQLGADSFKIQVCHLMWMGYNTSIHKIYVICCHFCWRL